MTEFFIFIGGVVVGMAIASSVGKDKNDCNPNDEKIKQEISDKLDKVISDIKSTIKI